MVIKGMFPTIENGADGGGAGGGGGGTGAQPQNNAGETGGQPADSSQAKNNDGQTLDPESFWKQPQDTTPQSPGDDGKAFAESFKQQLSGFAPPAIVDAAVAAELADGKYDSLNNNVGAAVRAGLETALKLSMSVMAEAMKEQQSRFDQMIEQRFGNRDMNAQLVEAIPAAKNPALRPIVDRIHAQSMTMAKGDSKAAINMTKQMLEVVLKETAGTMDLTLAPNEPGSRTSAPADWIAELLAK